MDYEKKYNEALKWMRELYPGLHGATKEDAEHYFPELRESEDERIIRAIIDALYSHTNSINLLSLRGYQMENIEAWLEKHKYDRMKPVYDNQDSFESALGKAWKDYNDSGAITVDGCEDNYVECAHAKGFREGYLFGLEKQKKQKPNYCHHEVDETGWTEEYRKAYYDGWNNCNMQHEQLKAGQKLETFHSPYNPDEYEVVMEGNATSLRRKEQKSIESVAAEITKDKDSAIKFLKSAGIMNEDGKLAEKYCLEQKSAEWNHEDEIMRDRIIGALIATSITTASKDTYKEEIEWLKSLRPSWKPSEEQMEAFRSVLEYEAERVGSSKYLEKANSLYEQLKKL